MRCWIFDRSDDFSEAIVGLMSTQEQWRDVECLCFNDDLATVACNLGKMLDLPDVVIINQRKHDVHTGAQFFGTFHVHGSRPSIIYVDRMMQWQKVCRYEVGVYEELGKQFVHFAVGPIEKGRGRWEDYLLHYLEESLRERIFVATIFE